MQCRALGAGAHDDLRLMVGLPVEVMQSKELALQTRDELRAWIVRAGEHRYQVNGEAVTLQVRALDVLAQPAGAYFGWLLASDGQPTRSAEELKASVAIADIGFNTLDLFAMQGGQVLARYTGGDTAGMRRAAEVVLHSVHRAHEISLSLHEADALLCSRQPEPATAAGMVDLAATTAQARDAVASAITSLIERQWGQARQFRTLLFTGGGAEALRATLTRHYPYGVVLPGAVTANAAGLAKAARRKLG
ncbi:MAG: ParM/StbA family protein [Ardenticatenales bacterium]|nr:ParM/StbA family protein [Ardenticatenales bacterium]